jgi:murein DD-endopeptidase MepM/ murein hydrolase activator NlpD
MDEATVGEIPVASGNSASAAPATRRSTRRHPVQRVEIEPTAAPIDLSPVTANSRRAQREDAPSIPIPDVPVEQILAESVVIVSSPTEPVDVPVAEELLEDQPVAEPAQPAASAAHEDPFTAAFETFRGQSRAEAPMATTVTTDAGTPAEAHVAPRRGRRPFTRKALAAGATVGIMGIAGLLAVSMTLPAEAVAAAQGAQSSSATSLVAATSAATGKAGEEEIQAFVSSSDVASAKLERSDDFSTVSLVDVAAQQGIQFSDSLYTNDPEAAIQWPFMVGVAMSSPYGPRYGRLHAGIDLVPGSGAPIQAIADGTVREATESGGAYGVTVYVDHIIDGKLVTSHYAHMQYGSLRVKTGDKVKVGDTLGLVGDTGRSYGAHLHFEIIINGSTVDPLPWMNKNAGRYDGVSPVS